jgi:hypothetical protein
MATEFDKRIPELTEIENPTGELYVPVYDEITDTTYKVKRSKLTASIALSYAWNSDTVYPEDAIVVLDDTIWISQVADNESMPGTNGDWVAEVLQYGSSIKYWAEGVYTDADVYVAYDDGVDLKLYRLIDATRPYLSLDIAAEILAGDWKAFAGGGGGGTQNLEDVLTEGNDAGAIEIINLGAPTADTSADTRGARNTAITAAIDALKDSVPAAGDTLAKLYTLITAMGRPRGGWDASGGTVPGSATNEDGDFWRITVAGTIPGLLSGATELVPGDVIFAAADGATLANQFYSIQSNVTQATSSVLGLVKLYTDLAASNTDGSPTQAAVKAVTDLLAAIASPTFTGDPKAPTPAYNDNDTSIATTAFSQEMIRKSVDAGNISGTPTINLSTGKHIKANRNGNITAFKVSNGVAGETYYITLTASADYTFAWGTGADGFGSGNGNLPPVTQPIANGYASVEDIFTVYISQVTGKPIIVGTTNIRYN